MISARAKNNGNHYDVRTSLNGSGEEIEAEARAILKTIWSQKYGPKMIDSILEDFLVWRDEQIKEDIKK